MTQPQLPPRTILTGPADASHKIRTRQPPGSVLICTACGQSGRHGVTVTVPAPLPAVRPPLRASPGGAGAALDVALAVGAAVGTSVTVPGDAGAALD